MKKIIASLVITIFTLTVIFLSCNKIENNVVPGDKAFIEQSKSWFNTRFKNTAEFKNSTANGNLKTPNWKFGKSYTIGKTQFAEFPLIAARKKVYVSENLSETDSRRIVDNTKSKVLFYKTPGKNMEVRVIQFTPSFNYLKSKNFNLSNLSFRDYSKDFKGDFMMFDFDDNFKVGYHFANDAVKSIKLRTKILNTSNNGVNATEDECDEAEPGCRIEVTVVYYEVCTNGWNAATEGFNPNYCTIEIESETCTVLYCDGGGDIDNCLASGNNTPEECTCMLYGVGCEDGGGGGGGGDDPPEEPIAASFNYVNVFAVKQSGSSGTNEDWTIEQQVTINGMKFPNNPNNNYYTTFVETTNCYYHNNNPAYGGIYGNQNSLVYCTILGGHCTTNSSVIENGKKFTNTSSAIVHYPNYRNQQGQLAPFSHPYSNTRISYAESDL